MPGLQIYQRFPKASSVLITLSNRPDYEWSHIRRERGHEDPGNSINRLGKNVCEGSPTRLVKCVDFSSNTMDPWGPVVQAIESHSTECRVGKTQHSVENKCLRALRSGHWASQAQQTRFYTFGARRWCVDVCAHSYVYVLPIVICMYQRVSSCRFPLARDRANSFSNDLWYCNELYFVGS